jgi:NAD(P)-dependent dehydrogenase (short-subunit alcohol dehydrogenase family)
MLAPPAGELMALPRAGRGTRKDERRARRGHPRFVTRRSSLVIRQGREFVAGRLVVVTGGGKGIGRAIVERFAASGDQVVAVGRDAEALARTEAACRAAGHDVSGHVCDITHEQDVATLFESLGAVDVLVNNAGMSTSAPLGRHTTDDWNQQIAVNATGAFLCTRAVVDGMRARGWGRIVMVASTAGIAGYRYTAGYTASKHAAVGLMRAVAAELAGSGVTANSVCPAFVRSEMTDRSIARIMDTTGRSFAEAEAALAKSSPLGRLLEPEEVAAAVLYLASDEAAAVSGQTLVLG